jgi:hypothetical protein
MLRENWDNLQSPDLEEESFDVTKFEIRENEEEYQYQQ